jgi:hypothetical protein
MFSLRSSMQSWTKADKLRLNRVCGNPGTAASENFSQIMSDRGCRKRLYSEADRKRRAAADIELRNSVRARNLLTRCIAQRGADGALSTAELPKRLKLSGLDVVLSVGANSVGSHMFRRENAPLAVMTLVSLAILAVFIASS